MYQFLVEGCDELLPNRTWASKHLSSSKGHVVAKKGVHSHLRTLATRVKVGPEYGFPDEATAPQLQRASSVPPPEPEPSSSHAPTLTQFGTSVPLVNFFNEGNATTPQSYRDSSAFQATSVLETPSNESWDHPAD